MAATVRQPTRLGAKHAALEGGEALDEENIERLYERLAEGQLLSAHEMQTLWKTVEGVTTTPSAAHAKAEAHGRALTRGKSQGGVAGLQLPLNGTPRMRGTSAEHLTPTRSARSAGTLTHRVTSHSGFSSHRELQSHRELPRSPGGQEARRPSSARRVGLTETLTRVVEKGNPTLTAATAKLAQQKLQASTGALLEAKEHERLAMMSSQLEIDGSFAAGIAAGHTLRRAERVEFLFARAARRRLREFWTFARRERDKRQMLRRNMTKAMAARHGRRLADAWLHLREEWHHRRKNIWMKEVSARQALSGGKLASRLRKALLHIHHIGDDPLIEKLGQRSHAAARQQQQERQRRHFELMRGWEAWRRGRYNKGALAPEHAIRIPEHRRNQVPDFGTELRLSDGTTIVMEPATGITFLVEAACSAEKTRKLIVWLRRRRQDSPSMPILFVSMRRMQDDDLFATLVGELETMGFTNYLEAAPPAEGAARADFLKGAPCAIVSEQSLHLVDLELYADGVVAMDAEPQAAATQCSA